MDGKLVDIGFAVPNARRPGYWFDIILGRLVPALVFSIFLVDKFLLLKAAATAFQEVGGRLGSVQLLAVVTQLLGMSYFTLLVVLYVVRLPKRAGDARPWVILVSFFGSFSIILVTFLPGVTPRLGLVLAADLLVLVGLVYTVWSLAYLRRSFSILPEARRLVTGGPYGLSRHPLYLGEGVAAIGLTLPTIGWLGAIVVAAFLIAQYIRILSEERVLGRTFPEDYARYKLRVPRYLPQPWRSRS
jgi:protein-S-isoprenylcysteine O-methyltransferase Ste14